MSLFSNGSPAHAIIDETHEHGETPFCLACRDQRPKLISFLLRKDASCFEGNNAGITVLHWLAMMQWSRDLIEAVLHGAYVKAHCTQSPPDYATYIAGFTSTFRPAQRSGTPLQWTVTVGNVETVRISAFYGAGIDDDTSGLSPLEMASLASALLGSMLESYIIHDIFSSKFFGISVTQSGARDRSDMKKCAKLFKCFKLISPLLLWTTSMSLSNSLCGE